MYTVLLVRCIFDTTNAPKGCRDEQPVFNDLDMTCIYKRGAMGGADRSADYLSCFHRMLPCRHASWLGIRMYAPSNLIHEKRKAKSSNVSNLL